MTTGGCWEGIAYLVLSWLVVGGLAYLAYLLITHI